jgi:hypothetical protein
VNQLLRSVFFDKHSEIEVHIKKVYWKMLSTRTPMEHYGEWRKPVFTHAHTHTHTHTHTHIYYTYIHVYMHMYICAYTHKTFLPRFFSSNKHGRQCTKWTKGSMKLGACCIHATPASITCNVPKAAFLWGFILFFINILGNS